MTKAPSRLAPFAALSASYFAHVGFFNPYLPLWLKDLGLSLLVIGMLTSVPAATRLFAPYAWGTLSDRTGERVKLLRWGAGVALVASLGLWLNAGTAWLAVVLLLMFCCTSAMSPLSEVAIAQAVSKNGVLDVRRYGRVRLWGSLGFMVTVFVAGAWFDHFGVRHFPMWTSLTLLAVLTSTWFLPDHKEAAHPGEKSQPVWPILRQRPVRWFFAAAFFHVLAHISINVFFSLYLDSLGYDKTTIGLMWVVSVLAEIGWFFTQGRWLPRLSLPGWLVLVGGVAVFRMGVTAAFASSVAVLAVVQTLHAITFAAHHSVNMALLSQHFPGRLRGRGQALFTVVAYGTAGVLGGFLGGLLSSAWGLASVFWAAMVCGLIGTLCAVRVWRLQRPRHGEAD